MKTKIRAFWLGMIEFRRTITTRFAPEYSRTYEWGREWAHRLTFRRFKS